MRLWEAFARVFKRVPVEFLVYSAAALGVFFVLVVLHLFGISNVAEGPGRSYVLSLGVSVGVYLLPILFFGVISSHLRQRFKSPHWFLKAVDVVKYVFIYLFFVRAFNFLVLSAFTVVNGEYMIAVSTWYLRSDVWLKTNEVLDGVIQVLAAFPQLVEFIYVVYENTYVFIVLAPFILALFSAQLAREYTLAFIVTVVVCVMFWLAFPAIAPLHIATSETFAPYDHNTVLPEETREVQELYAKHETTLWGNIVHSQNAYWDYVYLAGIGFPISCNPSMHVIWSLLFVVYLFRAHRVLGCCALVVSITSIIGTVFFLQHYLIDVYFGALVAAVVLYLTERLLRAEKQYSSTAPKDWFGALEMLGGKKLR